MGTVVGDTYVIELEEEAAGIPAETSETQHYMNLVCDNHYHSRVVIQSRHDTLEEAQQYTRYRMQQLASELGGCGFDIVPAEEVDP